jgi:hypothetical protein
MAHHDGVHHAHEVQADLYYYDRERQSQQGGKLGTPREEAVHVGGRDGQGGKVGM